MKTFKQFIKEIYGQSSNPSHPYSTLKPIDNVQKVIKGQGARQIDRDMENDFVHGDMYRHLKDKFKNKEPLTKQNEKSLTDIAKEAGERMTQDYPERYGPVKDTTLMQQEIKRKNDQEAFEGKREREKRRQANPNIDMNMEKPVDN